MSPLKIRIEKSAIITIDVEDWFQVENFKNYIPFSKWTYKELRVEKNTYSLLEFFAYNTNRALNRSTISEHVWHYDFDRGTNFIDVYINRLRKKIDEGYEKKFIHTVRGYGYMFKS